MNSTETGHLSDAELVRYVDEGGDPAESGPWRRHVEECRQCDDATRAIRADSLLVSEWLDRAAFEADAADADDASDADDADDARSVERPTDAADALAAARGVIPLEARDGRRRPPAMTPWLRAAAILVLLAAPLAAFPGVRSWVAERVAPASPATDADAGGPAVAATDDEATVIRFVPEPGEFVVRFDPGTRGVITLDRSTDPEAELSTDGGEPEATVAASLLRIRNPDAARYRLRLPEATTGVWVMVGERAVAVSGAQIDRRAVVELR